MGLYSRVGYADAGALFPAYDPVVHAWLRLREDAGSLYWETSPDGQSWTVRRTAATPAWAGQSNLSLLFEAHRDAGTADFAELDSLNISRPGGLRLVVNREDAVLRAGAAERGFDVGGRAVVA